MNKSRLLYKAISVLGIPYDASSSFMTGPSEGPDAIRRILNNGASNHCTESGFNLSESAQWEDVGNMNAPTQQTVVDDVEDAVAREYDRGHRVLALGGDHSILYPVIRATRPHYEGLTLVQLDAHPDLYNDLDGDQYSHACPAARIMELYPEIRLIQIGIRTLNTHQRKQAERFGVEIHTAREWSIADLPLIAGPVYLTLDLDVLDPAFAPGVSHHEPGGLSSRQVLEIIQALPDNVIGADIVELNPRRDLVDMTAAVAAKCLKELLEKMIVSL
jgi:agmatinase